MRPYSNPVAERPNKGVRQFEDLVAHWEPMADSSVPTSFEPQMSASMQPYASYAACGCLETKVKPSFLDWLAKISQASKERQLFAFVLTLL